MYSKSIILLAFLGIASTTPTPKTPALEHYKVLRHNGPLDEKELGLDFDRIGTLEIRLSKITNLSKNLLRKFSNLENLTVAYSHMGKSEDDVFSNCCPKLKNLEINHWQEFGESDLKGLGTLPLERLEILDQNIPVLRSNVFTGTKLKSLSLTRNNLEKIEDGAFSNLEELEYLLISNNKLKTIPKKALENLKKLETLELVNNGLEKLTTDDLPELPSLTDIVIIRENLKEINLEGVHKVAPKLEEVFLIQNKGKNIPESSEKLKIHNWA